MIARKLLKNHGSEFGRFMNIVHLNFFTKLGFALYFLALAVFCYEVHYMTYSWYCIIPAIFSAMFIKMGW